MASWNTNVNMNFYGVDASYNENTDGIEFSGGRKIFYLKNTKPIKTFALLLSVDDSANVNGKTEFEWFLYWYENTISSGTVDFELPDLILHSGTKNYRLVSVPQWKGQRIKEISLQLEEV